MFHHQGRIILHNINFDILLYSYLFGTECIPFNFILW